jgi:hypothetical protein
MSKKKRKKDIPNEENIESFDYMKTIKTNLLNVLNNENILPIIQDLVIRTNKIVIHACQFIKLYCIHLFDNNMQLPIIDKKFITNTFIIITQRKDKRGSLSEAKYSDEMKRMKEFYEEHYKDTIYDNDVIYYDKLSYILPYEAIDIETNINTNIKEHFIIYLRKFVNITFNIQQQKDEIKKIKNKSIRDEKYKVLKDEFNKVKYDLLSLSKTFKSDSKYHEWIKEQRKYILPDKQSFDKDSIYYDLCSNTQDYLRGYIYINKQFESTNNENIKLFNILPLRSNIVPKHICIDTCGFISNFLGDESTTPYYKNYKQNDNQHKLWNRFFNLKDKIFKKKHYGFNYMIKTDGVAVSILFIHLDTDNKPFKYNPYQTKLEENITYIEDENITDEIRNKKVVCIDPNHSDLIYCGSKDENDKLQTFRYTQNQRRLETRVKKYNKLLHQFNKQTTIQGQNVKELEAVLSLYNKKTCNYNNFKDYLIQKNKLNYLLYSHYENKLFRKLKLNIYTNTQKSESKMIKNFKKKFGTPDNTLCIMGDYDKGDYHMKGLEPVICKKFRRLFRNAGYKTYLINEFRTSKLCNCCHKEIEPFLIRDSHKPKDKKIEKKILVNGLLSHKENKHGCEIIHNRDKNAVQNMLYIVKHIFETGKRPETFSRIHAQSTLSH